MGITVKAFIETNGNDQPEIRRFPLGETDAVEYKALREKLASLIEGSLEKNLVVVWRDNEGDEVTVTSDEELQLAVASAKEGIVRLYIRKSSSHSQSQRPNPAQGTLHPNVICDMCNNSIRGFRYKCTQCPDYDLCTNCEVKGQHSEHVMMRLPASTSCAESKQRHQPFHHCQEEATTGQEPPAFLHGFKQVLDNLHTVLGVPPLHTEGQSQEAGCAEGAQASSDQPWDHITGLHDLFGRLCTELPTANSHTESQKEDRTCAGGCDSESSQRQQQQNPMDGLHDVLRGLLSELGGASSSEGQPHLDHLHSLNELFSRLMSEANVASSSSEHQNRGTTDNTNEENNQNTHCQAGISPSDLFQSVRETIATILSPTANTERSNIAEAVKLLAKMGFQNEQGWLTKLMELKQGRINDVLDTIRDLNSYAEGNTESVPRIVLSLFDAYPSDRQMILSVLESMKSSVPPQHFEESGHKVPIVVA